MKRPRGSQKAAYNDHKRRKLEKNPRPPSGKAKRKVRLDDLQWKGVSMPDRLEDFEGFYGLEEIDDVEVVKDTTTGQVSFHTTKTEEQVEIEREEARRLEEEEARRLDAETFIEEDSGSRDSEDETSWEGFADEEEGQAVEELNEVTQAQDGLVDTQATEHEPRNGATDSYQKEKESKQKHKAGRTETSTTVNEQNGLEKSTSHHKEPTDSASLASGAFEILANLNNEEDEDEYVDVSAWEDLELSTATLASLSKLKFTRPTHIQSSAIPEIMSGHDVIGKAATGSGKTLAFGIPILESYLASQSTSEAKLPLALIISPTRELAHQITAHLTTLCSGDNFDSPSIATITGGLSVEKQRRLLAKADIVVGTPGRLWDVISSGQGLVSSFKRIKFLVVDEADRLLSQGHYKELSEILNILDRDDEGNENDEFTNEPELQRQTLVFSATFHKGLQQKLAGKASKGGDLMNKQESMEYLLEKLNFKEARPKFIDANPASQMATGLREGLIECAGTEKDLYLYALLLFHPKKRALIFTNSISAVRRLTPFLKNLNLPALPLHSEMAQKARLRSVEHFTEKPGSILVATDVAARGLDIPGVQLIIHYHLPRAADTYVHRSGRTARAEASGSSILICAPEEVAGVRRLVAKVHARAEQAKKSKKTAYFIRTLDIDRRVVSRLKPRATLSKKLADAESAKQKKNSGEDLFREAAEDLGIDYDSDTFEAEAKGRRGRGSGRKKKEKAARETSKGEMQAMRAELKSLLQERVNVGVSARYLTSGGIDVDALMKGHGNAEFLGDLDGLGFDED